MFYVLHWTTVKRLVNLIDVIKDRKWVTCVLTDVREVDVLFPPPYGYKACGRLEKVLPPTDRLEHVLTDT